ncbi:MAG: DUF2892 domain-containing protein [Flavobacteriaceae bacterium]|nr:DUF2892 domain-containing protein [Flavobacteriaceae bacterium]
MNKILKPILALLLIVGGVFLITQREIAWGIICILLSSIPILLYFRNEFILLAFWKMRNQDMEAAKMWLSKITNPDKQLIKKQLGYYNFMLGLTEAQNNLTKSETHMRKALDHGLSFAHDRAMAKMNLAAGAMTRGRKQEAQKLLADAKAEDKQNMLTDQIKIFEEQLKKMNMGRNMQNPHMRKRGKYF